jgi:hypothetical protein
MGHREVGRSGVESVPDRFERHDPRASRYWELVGIINGRAAPTIGSVEDWKFVAEAVRVHLA